jgi:pyruvate dehydrogenase E2 component (dihydrolipoamide acetyltransferase)
MSSVVEIVMPRLSDAMEQGTIVRWLKDVGDQVEVGDELVEVETDKATVIYEAEVAGLLSEILVREGEAQQLGGPIARLGGAPVSNGSAARPPATPVARRRARELGVELTALQGTGPRGRIRLSDVENA